MPNVHLLCTDRVVELNNKDLRFLARVVDATFTDGTEITLPSGVKVNAQEMTELQKRLRLRNRE